MGVVKIPGQHVTIVLPRVEVDTDREATEVEKSLHFGADSGSKAQDT